MPKRRNPLPDEIEELFVELWQLPGFASQRGRYRPQVDCYRTDDPPAVTVVVDLAGIEPDDVDITVSERTVTIVGRRCRPRLAGRVSYRQMEIEYGPFRRLVRLPEDVDPEAARAEFDRGMVTITLPVADQAPVTIGGRITIEVQRS